MLGLKACATMPSNTNILNDSMELHFMAAIAFNLKFLLLYLWFFAYMYVWYPWSSEEVIGSSGTGVTDGCEPP